ILTELPRGAVGLLIAVMFSAALSSKASELAALGTTTTVDVWRHLHPLAAADEARNVRVARRFTAMWGLVAVAFALFAGFAENLIDAINILGSIFYGVLLGLFLVAFFLRRVGGSAVFLAAAIAQVLVIVMYLSLSIGYLWYNLIGCAACIGLSLALQAILPSRAPVAGGGGARGGGPASRSGRRPGGFFPRGFFWARSRRRARRRAGAGGRSSFFSPDSVPHLPG